MLCPPILAEIDTSTRMHRENTMRQFNYSLPLGINIMGNWVPFILNIIWSPTNIGRVIAAPMPDDRCWFYAQNIDEYTCHNAIMGWEHFYKEIADPCDEYTDSNGVVHKPTYTKLFDGPLYFTFDTKRICYSGQRYYKAPQVVLPDGAKCRPECFGKYNDDYEEGFVGDPASDAAEEVKTAVAIPQSRQPVIRNVVGKKKTTSGCATCARRI